MGNVGASSKPIQEPNVNFQPSIVTMADDQNQSKSSSKTSLENPGTMEELHKKCKGKYHFIDSNRNPARIITKYLFNYHALTSNVNVSVGLFRRYACILRGRKANGEQRTQQSLSSISYHQFVFYQSERI